MRGGRLLNNHSYLGYEPGDTFIHRLSGTTKLICFLSLSLIAMATFDTRYLIAMGIFSVALFIIADINWESIKFPMQLVFWFSVINLVMIYIFAPEQGVEIYGTRNVIWEGIGRYSLTWEQLLYELNIATKYFTTIPLAFIFIMTTHTSEFASSLNRIKIPYRSAYAVALTLRYIPDIQAEYFTVQQAQQARGIEMSSKANTLTRLKHSANIAVPLIFSSLERIEVISQAMELRRFGKKNHRTWYSYRPFQTIDMIALIVVGLILCIGIGLFFINGGRFWNPFSI